MIDCQKVSNICIFMYYKIIMAIGIFVPEADLFSHLEFFIFFETLNMKIQPQITL